LSTAAGTVVDSPLGPNNPCDPDDGACPRVAGVACDVGEVRDVRALGAVSTATGGAGTGTTGAGRTGAADVAGDDAQAGGATDRTGTTGADATSGCAGRVGGA